MTPQPPVEPYILDDEYRQFIERHYTQIAAMMAAKRIRRAPWRIELPDGRVFKFTVTSYAKRGSAAAAADDEVMRDGVSDDMRRRGYK